MSIGIILALACAFAAEARAAPAAVEQQLKVLVTRLADADPKVRQQAIDELAKAGRDAIPLLADAFTSGGPSTGDAAEALVKFTTARDEVIPIFVHALDSPVAEVRKLAAKELGVIGPDAASAVPALVSKFDDPYLRRVAPSAVAGVGDAALPALIDAMSSPDHLIRRGAIEAIEILIPDPEVEALESATAKKTGQAGNKGRSKPSMDSQRLVEPLLKALKDPEEDIRADAATALGHFTNHAAATVPALMGLLKDPDEGVRAHAVNALTKLRPLPCAQFVDALGDPDEHMHRSAASLLNDCRPLDKSLIPRLLTILESPDPDITLWGSHVFEYYGAAAVPELVAALDNPNTFVRRGAARGLVLAVAPKPEQAVPALTKRLDDPDAFVREYALEALARYGDGARSAVDGIVPLLNDKQAAVRKAAATTLWAIGPHAVAGVSGLKTTLRDSDPEVRQESADALGAIGDPSAVKALTAALRDPDTSVAVAAAKALAAIGAPAESALDTLAIAHRDQRIRRDVEESIRGIAEALQNGLGDRTEAQLKQATADLARVHALLLQDGVSTDVHNALDRAEAALKGELRQRSPVSKYVSNILSVLLGGVLLYGVLLPVLIVLYPYSRYARTAVNSGFFRFPLLHRSILTAPWARRKIFHDVASLVRDDAGAAPTSYIQQSVYPVGAGGQSGIRFEDVPQAVAELFAAGGYVMIKGRSGTGKSVLLQCIARKSAESFLAGRSNELPVLIDFRTTSITGSSLPGLLKNRLRKGEVRLSDGALDHLIQDGGFLILADSLNEAPKDELKAQLNDFINRDARNRMVMAGQEDLLKRRDVPVFQLESVTPAQARDYLARELGADLWPQLPEEARKLATSPQDLAVLASLIAKSGPELVPTRRAALYRKLLETDTALHEWVELDSPKIRALFRLAYDLFQKEPPVTPIGEIGSRIRECLVSQDLEPTDDDVEEVLEATKGSSLFKTETSAAPLSIELLSFKHEVIGKYLTAQHVLSQISRPDAGEKISAIASMTFDQRWEEVFAFVIEGAEERHDLNGLLKALVDRRRKKNRLFAERVVATALAIKGDVIEPSIRERFTEIKINEQRLDAEPEDVTETDDAQPTALAAEEA
ncbi:MAG TPA: HEAT repeat domain-containing protein [Bradyrhizobium sp.]|uniref:HEAT repeat domain-containing protein n=1 Tax=Bradyrhizobium sp. TaxID=376 RepID=UPI002C9B4E2E|nr:HEAT repeat domain-containing protein [Bradyrhizobium sp.]HLZ06571.1 HEAT repeat domain-containing protein [Bradyrhizobium sp.]